jgi:hypothetical protein
MDNKTFYFPHDYNSRGDERILMLRSEFGNEGYGVFWMILETMAEACTGQINRVAIGGLSLGYCVAKDRLTSIIDFCVKVGLFKESPDGAIFSERMMRHLAFRNALKEAGKRGAEKRWSVSQKNRVANGKEKKRKEKERKDESGADAPTPSQEAKIFFNEESSREEMILKIIGMGVDPLQVRSEIRKFCAYWTERNKSGTKQRWETEKTFEVKRRLKTWIERSFIFSQSSHAR